MTSRKEPHRQLSDHMQAAHGKVWDEVKRQYVSETSRLQDAAIQFLIDAVRRR